MAVLIGTIVGAIVLIYVLSLLFEWAIFKRVLDTPKAGRLASTATATIAAIILYGFGNADGGPWNPLPGLPFYVLGGVIVAILQQLALKRRLEAEMGDVSE